MLIICEECGKKYKVDETKIKGKSAQVKCKLCGNIIKITKPEPIDPESALESREEMDTSMSGTDEKPEKNSEKERSKSLSKAKPPKKGLKIGIKLMLIFLVFLLLTGGSLAYVYLRAIPPFIEKKIEMRAMDIAKTAANTILPSIRNRDYAKINQDARFFSRLSGVGYFYVTNERGIVIAGRFNHLNKFSPDFAAQVKKEGFPSRFARKNRIPQGLYMMRKKITLGGQNLIEYAVRLKGNMGEVHVGIFTEDIDKAIQLTLRPLFMVLALMGLFGIIIFFLVAQTISRPIKRLTEIAQRISLGELDLPIDVKGGGEIRELVDSLERMRFSIKSAIERLRKR